MSNKKNDFDLSDFKMPDFTMPEYEKEEVNKVDLDKNQENPENSFLSSNNQDSLSSKKSVKIKDKKEKIKNVSDKPKLKKNKKMFLLIPLILVLLVVTLVVRGYIVGQNTDIKTEENSDIEVVSPNDSSNETDVDDSLSIEEESSVDSETTDVPSDVEIETNNELTDEPSENDSQNDVKFGFENDMLGIKFNYDSNLYIKENTEDIFNMLKSVIPEGETDFNIYEDKLYDTLTIAKLTTGDSDGLYISVSLLGFELSNNNKYLLSNGEIEEVNETVQVLSLTDEALISMYDENIKDSITKSGCQIVNYDPTYIKQVGYPDSDGNKPLKGIITSRIYTGPKELTSDTGTVDVLQCTIPLGVNSIMITAVTDGRPIEIDKSIIFNEIIDSFCVTTPDPSLVETDDMSAEGTVTNEVETQN